MIPPNTALLRFMNWIAVRLGFELDLREEGIVDSLDEQEVVEQLQYGRDKTKYHALSRWGKM